MGKVYSWKAFEKATKVFFRIREKIASMYSGKVKRRYKRLLEHNEFKRARLIYAAADEILRKELDVIIAEIQHKYFGY